MQIGPRYKRARFLGASVFNKTQTQKYAMRAQRKTKAKKGGRGGKSQYGEQMLEKQKARYSYGVSSGQFSKYVKNALAKSGDSSKILLQTLESRLDNVVMRAGFAPTRSAGRQMVSHGHIQVNGKNVTVPSYSIRLNDKITVRSGSANKAIFRNLTENIANGNKPSWMQVDADKKEITIIGVPGVDTSELLFDIRSVLEFYTR